MKPIRITSSFLQAHILAAIGVVVAHAESRSVRGPLEHEYAIRADPAMAIAEVSDLLFLEMQITQAVIEHHEVVARTVHLGETQLRHPRF